MNIVWLSWKDRAHPLAGGAEKVSGEIMDRLARDGHSVRLLTARYPNSSSYERISHNFEVYRGGNRYSVYIHTWRSFRRIQDDWADVVIDEMNTLPFWAGYYAKKSKNILLAYQLAREVWFYQMIFPLSVVGYLFEPLMLLLLSRGNYKQIATESESSKNDLEAHGFNEVKVFRVGIATPSLPNLPKKDDLSLILSLGAMRPMKRTLDAVMAFEYARSANPNLRMVIAGDNTSSYGQKVMRYIEKSEHKSAIDVKGFVSSKERLQLMQDASLILVTSIKEGWGLIVTEANSQGTPAIVYDVDGLRDSVSNGVTGITVPNGDPREMGKEINSLISKPGIYDKLRHDAWIASQKYTFENSYSDFMDIIGKEVH